MQKNLSTKKKVPELLQKERGFTLVEVLISAAIILASVVALIGVHSLYMRTALSNNESIQAAYLAEEGIEVVRFWRDLSWRNRIETVPLNNAYGLVQSGTGWATSTSRYVGRFDRRVTLFAVERNASNDIVASGGTVDPNTLLVTSEVSWAKGGATTTKSISTYITDLYEN
jgi:Tfp pilus assembly protein PilV